MTSKFFMFICLTVLSNLYAGDIPLKREFLVNDQVNPCVNLYEYACSNVISTFKLRADRSKHTFAFNDSFERILEFKKEFLKSLRGLEVNSDYSKEVKNYFLSCLNKDARAKEEKLYVQNKIIETNKIKSLSNWYTAQIKRLHSGVPGIIHYHPVDNFDIPEKSDLIFTDGYGILPEKSYAKNIDLMKDLEIVVTTFFKAIQMDNPEKRAQIIIKYELAAQENSLYPVEERIAFSQRKYINRTDIIKKYKNLKLDTFFKLIPNTTLIRYINPKTLPFLNELEKKFTLDDLKTIQIFYEVYPKLDQAYPDFYTVFFNFRNKYLGGKKVRSELEEECTMSTMGRFGAELDYLVISKMFPNFSSLKVSELVEMIRKSILNSLEKNTWLSLNAKKEAKRKIANAYMRLVAPQNDEAWHLPEIGNYTTENFIANGEIRSHINEKRLFRYFTELKDIHSWEGVQPLQVNAFYQASYNQFTMMQGILQYPFYDQENSLVENLAGIGMVVGHELGHGIDDQGSRYDANGVLRDWMTNDDIKKFKSLTKSLIDQYDQAGMNGAFTLGENIGDLVGLNAAYDAAFSNNIKNEEDLKAEQRKFFISYARSWCEVQLPGYLTLRIKSDPHSIGIARTNEIVKHFSGFKHAFNCKDSDPLILPEDKQIHIW